MSDATRPNLLYVFTDQQAHTAMSCAGNGDLDTFQAHRQRLADWCVTVGDAFAHHDSHPGCAAIPSAGFVPIN